MKQEGMTTQETEAWEWDKGRERTQEKMAWIQKENEREWGKLKRDLAKMNCRFMGVCGEVKE